MGIASGDKRIPCVSNYMKLDIVDSAIHGVVCQKSDFYGNSDIQNSKKLDPLENKSKKIHTKISSPFKYILVQEINQWCITKSRIRYTYSVWFV
jgi:hypothetical protein